jgi:membrane protein implicated in regulation of membrane protease activity
MARMKKFLIINMIAMAAMFVGLINAITFKEIWVLLAATIFLVILTIYALKEKRKLRENQPQNNGSR